MDRFRFARRPSRLGLLLVAFVVAVPDGCRGADEANAEAYPLSLALQTLERDLTDPDYRAVLGTMIHTDLRAEWQRVATPDNYVVFAQRHGGPEAIANDPDLKTAHERRKRIADGFLELMREAHEKKKLKVPFDDPALLLEVLTSADRRLPEGVAPSVAIEPLLPVPGAEKHWPCFRGPSQQGLVYSEVPIPASWAADENVLWRAGLPGRGNSSPVIWGHRLFVTAEGASGDDKEAAPDRLLLCFDRRDGSPLWQHAAPKADTQEGLYWKNTFASATPVTDGERVIAFFGNAGLVCCDMDGERLWHRDVGTFPTIHGPGTSPVLYRDLVYLIQDQTSGESLCAAYDVRTGEQRWKRERPNNSGWSTPVLLRVGDRDELIYNGSFDVTSYDPATGKTLWMLEGTSEEAIPMVVSGGGLIYSTSGRNGPSLAIRPGGNGDVTETHLVWRNKRGAPHVPSPLYHDGRLYFTSDTGIAVCLDAATGDTLWQERLRGRFSASPLLLGTTILFLNEDGVAYMVESAREFRLVGENDLDAITLATPAILDGRIYFRTETHLICVGTSESRTVNTP
ncbi:MAG: PQQ-binding-like beta-propeller repeat protein [Planctomycetaceae bacterium]